MTMMSTTKISHNSTCCSAPRESTRRSLCVNIIIGKRIRYCNMIIILYYIAPLVLHISNEKGHGEEAFEWVPPDTTKELATDYMKALPTEKLPIKGSAGAAIRRQLLQKQLPLHDIDYKVCDELSEQEQKQFEQYLENIRKYVGQGTVTKVNYK